MDNTKRERADVIIPKAIREERDLKKQQKEERKAESDKRKALREKEYAVKKAENKKADGKALFVRNIGYDTTQEDFREFMERFGPLRYAVLCKSKEGEGHKGTGFVLFQDDKAG